MKPVIKFESVPAQNGAPEQVRAYAQFEVNGEPDRLITEPFVYRADAVKHLIRLDPDLFVNGYDIAPEEHS